MHSDYDDDDDDEDDDSDDDDDEDVRFVFNQHGWLDLHGVIMPPEQIVKD